MITAVDIPATYQLIHDEQDVDSMLEHSSLEREDIAPYSSFFVLYGETELLSVYATVGYLVASDARVHHLFGLVYYN